MKIFVGVTDRSWYETLKSIKPDEINFWRPGGSTSFKAINPGDLFLFKLHSPDNHIVGGAYFIRFSQLPLSLAWESFGIKNGVDDEYEFLRTIQRYRSKNTIRSDGHDHDPTIGCILLGEPFFFEKEDWVDLPEDWSPNIVQGKTYDTDTEQGYQLYKSVHGVQVRNRIINVTQGEERFGKPQTYLPRLGQGAFRVVVTEAYERRCAVTGEKTLPVLDAAHIKPYALQGQHAVDNGLLLRKDLHALFDRGYITVYKDLTLGVSDRLYKDFGNGRDYKAMHGRELMSIPKMEGLMPRKENLEWHNNHVFLQV